MTGQPDREEYQRRVVLMRAERSASISQDINAWQQEIAGQPVPEEVAGSPLGVPMRVIAQFDSRRRARDGTIYPHGAIDVEPEVSNGEPVPIVAAMGGRVLFTGVWDPDSGYTVMIGGRDGKIYSYAHLQPGSVNLRPGEHVERGGALGLMGNSGNARERDCLHYTVRERSEDVAAEVANPDSLALSTAVVQPIPERRIQFSDFTRVEPTIYGEVARIGGVFAPIALQTAVPAPTTVLVSPSVVDIPALPPAISGGANVCIDDVMPCTGVPTTQRPKLTFPE